MKEKTGNLVISLDFELLWGVFDKVEWQDKIDYFNNTRKVVPEILALFEEYSISCTWACVGMLFNSNWDEWEQNIPNIIPDYENRKLSAYEFGKSIKSKRTELLCFAPDIIQRIHNSPKQEIGTHTYSHYYCLEAGQDQRSFKADITTAKRMAENMNISLSSLVFPRNQLNKKYFETCNDLRIASVRSNPDAWYWEETQKDTLTQKIFRTGDAYIGRNNKSYKLSDIDRMNNISIQPASRLLRPFSGNRVFNDLKLKRILKEMTHAAQNGQIYHIWWHPHNFGTNPENNLQDLINILEVYKKLNLMYNFSSVTMAEIRNKTSS